jgi:hypothetical protein
MGTIKSADDGSLLISLFNDDLYVRVLTSEGLYGCEQISDGVC